MNLPSSLRPLTPTGGSPVTPWALGLTVLLFVAWAAWLTCLYWLYGERSFLRIHDCGDSNVPMAVAAHLDPPGFIVGARNAAQVCGFDQKATWGSILQDQLLVRLPIWLGYALSMALQRLVAGFGMTLLGVMVLRLRWVPSIIAGLGYSLFSQRFINESWGGFTYYDAMVLPGVPLVLLGLHYSMLWGRRHRMAGLLAAGAIGSVYAWTGSYLLAVFPMVLFAVWPTLVLRGDGVSFGVVVRTVAVFGAVWTAWCLPFVKAALISGQSSHRVNRLDSETVVSGVASGWGFVESALIANWPFVAIMLIGLGICRSRTQARMALLVLAVAIAVILAKPLVIVFGSVLGFLQGFNFQRFYLLLPFVLMLAGAVGLDALLALLQKLGVSKSRARLGSAVGFFICAGLMGWVGKTSADVHEFASKMLVGGWSSAVYDHPEIRRIGELRQKGEVFRVATVAMPGSGTWHPDMMAAYGLESADGYVPLYARRYNEYWQEVLAPRWHAEPNERSKFATKGNRVYLQPAAAQWSTDTKPLELRAFADLSLLAGINVRYLFSPVQLIDDRLTLVSQTAASQPAKHKRNTRGRMGLMAGGFVPWADLFVYELKQFSPRFYLASEIQWVDESENAPKAVGDVWRSGLMGKAVVLSQPDVPRSIVKGVYAGGGTVTEQTLTADRIELTVDAVESAILVSSNTDDPRWKATLDGTSVDIFPANHAFQGVAVPRGRHSIVFEYGQ